VAVAVIAALVTAVEEGTATAAIKQNKATPRTSLASHLGTLSTIIVYTDYCTRFYIILLVHSSFHDVKFHDVWANLLESGWKLSGSYVFQGVVTPVRLRYRRPSCASMPLCVCACSRRENLPRRRATFPTFPSPQARAMRVP